MATDTTAQLEAIQREIDGLTRAVEQSALGESGVTTIILQNISELIASVTGGALEEQLTQISDLIDDASGAIAGLAQVGSSAVADSNTAALNAIDSTLALTTTAIEDTTLTSADSIVELVDDAGNEIANIGELVAQQLSNTITQSQEITENIQSEVTAVTLAQLAAIREASDTLTNSIGSIVSQQLQSQIEQQQFLQAAISGSLKASFEGTLTATRLITHEIVGFVDALTRDTRSVAGVIESESDQTQIILSDIGSALKTMSQRDHPTDIIGSLLSTLVRAFG